MNTVDGQAEVERKRQLPGDDAVVLETRLVGLGWTSDLPVAEVDTYYSRPDVDYMETVECLRVRRRGDFMEITYKPASTAATHSADDVISKPETNVQLVPGQVQQAEQLLENIGMRRLVQVEKRRTTFRHPAKPGLTVSIDHVAGVGVFVETEVISDCSDSAAVLVAQTESVLGVDDCPTVDLPYRDLVLSRAASADAPPGTGRNRSLSG
ncbi:class IV adenylate cyclase [Streptomyces sp. NPDC018057]|uniref:class IV adenylate cyclase n=1 Tax=unclassified Streptomyces TaxID=2593676 RepID=UPI00379E844D